MAQGNRMYLAESHTDAVQMVYTIDDVHFHGKTRFQDVHVVQVPRFGKCVFLDWALQSALSDEFIFHDAMVHPAMIAHPNPRRALVAGGGEGATLRDVLRHNTVEAATMVDIDSEFVQISREWLSEWHQGAFDDPRTTMAYADARQWLNESNEQFDVFLSDLTNPTEAGPAVMLFTREYFETARRALSPGGVFALQAGCANHNYPYLFVSLIRTLREVFPIVRPYWAFVTSFMMPWGFILASDDQDPLRLSSDEVGRRMAQRDISCQYYSPEMHHGMFALPPYIDAAMAEYGRVLTDAEPYHWTA